MNGFNFIKRMCGTTTLCNLVLIKIKNLGFADLNLFFFLAYCKKCEYQN